MNPRQLFPNALRVVATAALLSLIPRLALAQPTPPPQAPHSAPANNQVLDLVRLTDGTQYQGVLGEVVPGSHVTMLLVTGQVLRFDATQIAYAGRADGAAFMALTGPSAPVAAQPAPASTEAATSPAITQPAVKLASGPVRDDRASSRDYLESAHRDGTLGGIIMGLGVPLGFGLFTVGMRAMTRSEMHCVPDLTDVSGEQCGKEGLNAGGKAALVLGPLITTAAVTAGTWLLIRRKRTLREHDPAYAQAEEARLAARDTRSDAERVAAQRSDLLKCLTSSPAQRLEAKLSIGSDGKLKTLEPSRVLPQQEQSCLVHAMGMIEFSAGAARKLRLVLAH